MDKDIKKILLTPNEAADQLSVSPRKLWSMTFEDRSIPHLRCGRSVRYPVDSLKLWVKSQVKQGDCDDE